MASNKGCWNCLNHLGGGACRLNLEEECGKGEFEAWEPGGSQAPLIAEV